MKDKPPMGYNWISNRKETHNFNSFWKENSRHVSTHVATGRGRGFTG